MVVGHAGSQIRMKPTPVFSFRVDASLTMGTGHVMRCLTLAEALRTRGAQCHFICRSHLGNLIATIRQRGFSVAALPSVFEDFQPQADDVGLLPSHAHWLGCDWRIDAEQTLDVLHVIKPDWLMIDHYSIDARWERRLAPASKRVMVIDDLADREHECDLLLDQNWFGEQAPGRYRGLVPAGCRCMLGPAYALLRPEYAQLRSLMPPRDGIVRRALVFMGGSDPANQTGKVLDALMQPGLDQLVVDVVIGVNHPDPQGIARKVEARPATNLYSGLPSLAGWMARADLMIGGGGSTTWERMCLGLPAVVISIADNQAPTNLAMTKAGYIDFLGEMDSVSVDMVAAALRRRLANPYALKLMSVLTQDLVTGTGSRVVCAHLLGES